MASIQGVYVALFGRPADPTGLTYFNTVTKNGADLKAIGDLASTQEYKDRFAGKSNLEIVSSIYQSLFNRTPDVAGLTFFVNALNNGTQNINTIAINILDGAQGSDKTTVDLKIAAADAYTKALDTGAEIVAYSGNAAAAQGRAFIAGVTTTAPTQAQVDKAVADMVTASGSGGTGAAGVTIALATGTDAVAPNSSDTKFKSTDGNDTIIGGTVLASTNVIDGGNGTDTLSATLADSTTAIKPNLKSVENVNLTLNAAALNGAAFDASGSTGIQKLALGGTFADSKTATISGVDKSTTVSLADLNTATGKAGVVALTYQNASGSSDAATISLNKVGTDTTNNGSVQIAAGGIENLTIKADGDAKVNLDVTDAKTVVLSGSGAETIVEVGTVTGIKSYDASGLTGNLDLKLAASAHTNGLTITLGKGSDTLTLTGSTTSETIVYNANNLSTAAKSDTIVGFNFADGTSSKDLVDLKAFALGADATVKVTTLASTGSNVPGMFDLAAKAFIALNTTASGVDVYVDVNKDGNFDATTDMVIHFTGAAATNIDKGDFLL